MPPAPTDLLDLCTRAADPSRRRQAVCQMARHLGAADLVIFITDPEIGTLVPAPGFPKTLPGRAAWRGLLEDCLDAGTARAEVGYGADASPLPALGQRCPDGSILVLLGGTPRQEKVADACRYLPLLCAVLRGEQAARISSGSERAARDTAAQLTVLAEALDTTRAQLQDALQKAAAANEQMEHELTERRRAEARLTEMNERLEEHVADRTAELQRMNEALRQSNRDLQGFAHVASHDLQEPLRKIAAFSNLLQVDCADQLSELGTDYLDRIQSASIRMSQLLSDLLTFSRVHTHARPTQRVHLQEVCQNVLNDLEVLLQESGGSVTLEDLPEIEAEPTLMHQLFMNLTANALKFHPPGVPPIVRIRGHKGTEDGNPTQGWCRVTVEDNGIGFEQKYADRIFAPFQRLHGRNSQYPGTGMGLAICRRIVEHHGGTITARSIPDRGTTFFVTLPLRQPATS